MSQASKFGEQAKNANAIYEMVGNSGASYIFFWFSDGSIIAARRLPADQGQAAAQFVFGKNTKKALDDCGLSNFNGTTYQKGQELLKRIQDK